jgi:hypothetical protein
MLGWPCRYSVSWRLTSGFPVGQAPGLRRTLSPPPVRAGFQPALGFRLFAALVLLLAAPYGGQGQNGDGASSVTPHTETYHYNIEWRLINAGVLKLTLSPSGTPQYPSLHSELDVQSAGLVSKLYKVEDKYFGNYDYGFCAISSQMSAMEGRRHRETSVTYDRMRNKADYLERDLIRNNTVYSGETDIPHCVHDVVGGLFALRNMRIDLGKSVDIPVTDGKKSVTVRVEAQEREDVSIANQVHKTVRYEAFIFNNVLFARKARLFVWLTDDAKKTPVQIRVRMNFPIGTVTLSLDKIEPS